MVVDVTLARLTRFAVEQAGHLVVARRAPRTPRECLTAAGRCPRLPALDQGRDRLADLVDRVEHAAHGGGERPAPCAGSPRPQAQPAPARSPCRGRPFPSHAPGHHPPPRRGQPACAQPRPARSSWQRGHEGTGRGVPAVHVPVPARRPVPGPTRRRPPSLRPPQSPCLPRPRAQHLLKLAARRRAIDGIDLIHAHHLFHLSHPFLRPSQAHGRVLR